MNTAQNPTIHIKSENTTEGNFTCDLYYWAPSEEDLKVSNKELTRNIFNILQEKVKNEIPTLLTYVNFLGEAEEYMVRKGIPFNKEIRIKYAKAIREELLNNLNETINFDETTGMISVSPYIWALEFGDFYRPAVKFISHCIIQWIDELEKTV